MFDRSMRYLAVSRKWLTDYGLTESPVGQSHYAVFPEIDARWKAAHQRGLAGETESVTGDGDRFVRADGAVQWITWEVRPWRDPDGGIGGRLTP